MISATIRFDKRILIGALMLLAGLSALSLPFPGLCQTAGSTSWNIHSRDRLFPGYTISDFEARRALAEVLSYDDRTIDAALREYAILIEQRPSDIQLRREVGALYVKKKHYAGAIDTYKTILSLKPGDRDAGISLALLYLMTGEAAKATGIFASLGEAAAGDSHKLLALARAYRTRGLTPQAVDIYRRALALDPKLATLIYGELGDTYGEGGNVDESIRAYQAALDGDSHNVKLRKKLARALARADRNSEALVHLRKLYRAFPGDREIAIALIEIYLNSGRGLEAAELAESLLLLYPDDIDLLVRLGDVEWSHGHARQCSRYYHLALDCSKEPEELSLRFADRMMGWGEFYRTDRIYRSYLEGHPDATEVRLKRASLLRASQRYEEAEGVYRQLLLGGSERDRSVLGLAAVKLEEKEFMKSLSILDEYLAERPDDPEALRMKGKVFMYAGWYLEARAVFQGLMKDGAVRVDALLDEGLSYLKEGDAAQSRRYFEDALHAAPHRVDCQFYAGGFDVVTSPSFVDSLMKSRGTAPDELMQWAALYRSHGYMKAAISCYRAILNDDPEYFPAMIDLAETLAIDKAYDDAISRYESLLVSFPDNSKLMIGLARVLGWSKRYDESLTRYDAIHELNPHDPVPLREKARTATWGKQFDVAMEAYRSLLTPAVDEVLKQRLGGMAEEPRLAPAVDALDQEIERESVFGGYECFVSVFEQSRQSVSATNRADVDFLLTELQPTYRIQKGAYLEKEAKKAAWNRRWTPALDAYERLISIAPGNEEALFDYAQVACSLGLCDWEKTTYERLLAIDPLHGLARQALDRQQIMSRPTLQVRHAYWHEEGRGDLSRITRNRSDIALDIPIWCRYHLRVTGHHWIETPDFTGESYDANGYSLGLAGVITPYIKGEVEWTTKTYDEDGLGTTGTGFAAVWFNMRDYAHLGLGYEKKDELYNYFGLADGIQSDTAWLSMRSDVTRALEMSGTMRYMDYSDDNRGQYHSLRAGYSFTDHPRVFKIILSGEYRDTDNESIYQYAGDSLVDIVHPYWTPKNYLGTAVTLEWYHDISQFFFCGSALHAYDIQVSLGAGSSGNSSVEVKGEWIYELSDNWRVSLTGLIHRSQEWNAEGLWASIQYRF